MDVAVLIRDMDQQPDEREASLVSARDEMSEGAMKVVLALPRAKREAWVLNGFVALDSDEQSELESVRAELSFDPCEHSEELHAMKTGAKRDAKRVLARLIRKDAEREEQCWLETDWKVLRSRGKGSGLRQFLEEVKEQLVPLVTGSRGNTWKPSV